MLVSKIGGVLLIVGAFALWRGSIRWSLIFYGLADLCWLSMAFMANDMFGGILIIIGIVLGVLVYVKTHTGVFHENLNAK